MQVYQKTLDFSMLFRDFPAKNLIPSPRIKIRVKLGLFSGV